MAATGTQANTKVSASVSTAVQSNLPRAGGRWCPPDHFGFASWKYLEPWLNKKYAYRAKTQVWQAPNDASVWNTFCILTFSKGYTVDQTGYPKNFKMADGTTVNLRLASKSGGYTIDLKRPNVKKLYKVHVAK